MKISEMNNKQVRAVAAVIDYKPGLLKVLGGELDIEMRGEGGNTPWIIGLTLQPLREYLDDLGAEVSVAIAATPPQPAFDVARHRKD